jgi:rhodanese-related sulfurtransferase
MVVKQILPLELNSRLQQESAPLLLDVREPFEFETAKILHSVLIPMGEIQHRYRELNQDQDIVVICHHGIRSQCVADYLVNLGFNNIFNLTGGIDAWSVQCDASVPQY